MLDFWQIVSAIESKVVLLIAALYAAPLEVALIGFLMLIYRWHIFRSMRNWKSKLADVQAEIKHYEDHITTTGESAWYKINKTEEKTLQRHIRKYSSRLWRLMQGAIAYGLFYVGWLGFIIYAFVNYSVDQIGWFLIWLICAAVGAKALYDTFLGIDEMYKRFNRVERSVDEINFLIKQLQPMVEKLYVDYAAKK